jgi:hypothetical protein
LVLILRFFFTATIMPTFGPSWKLSVVWYIIFQL